MRKVQMLLSDFIKLFIGPHEEDSPVHPWWRILLVLGFIASMFLILHLTAHGGL